LKAAVTAFFALRLGDAGRAITEARFALRASMPPTDDERWAGSLCLEPDSRLIDIRGTGLPVRLAAFYKTEAKKPENATSRLVLVGSPESRVEAPIGSMPMTLTVPLRGLAPGEHVLSAEIRSGDKILATVSQTIAVVDRLDGRLTALKRTISGWPEAGASVTVDRESARGQLRMLESLAAKMTLESDFPAATMLSNLEAQVRAADRSQPYLGKDRAGQAWVTVVTKSGRRVTTRVFVPDAAPLGIPLPIVVALHGAGGSENMFFESYGHGAIVDRCRERGWLLVAPRSTPFVGPPVADLIDELAKLYSVDLKRVMLIGHSMGAGQAVASASSEPTRYAAVAALGGGGSIQPSPSLKHLPFFVGIGSEDFALKGSKSLAQSLERAGVETVIFREYATIEHLAIVQVALPDVFRFFDERAKSR
jgi:predicted esterase